MVVSEVPVERRSLPSRGLKTSTLLWLEEKSVRDNELWNNSDPDLENYWIVDNKCYDLNEFISKHPGGQSWIRLTKGQDVTEHFMTHHLDEKRARQVMQKYYLKDCPNKIIRFTFNEDGLYRSVKRKVLAKYTKEELQDETSSRKMAWILLAFTLSSLLATAYTGSYILAMCYAVSLIGMLGIGHNFVHHKENYFSNFYLFTGFIPREWQIMHALSHHQYPNTELDYEAATFQPIAFFLRSMPPNKWYTELAVNILFMFLQPLNMTFKLFVVPIIKRRSPQFLYAFPLLVLALFYYFQGNFWEAFKLYIFIYAVSGSCFLKILFCGHKIQELWTEGGEKIEDYGEHTVLSTSDTDTHIRGIWSYLLLAGFNIHVAHHFFPTVDHSKLPPIMEIIKQTCQEMGIRYTTKDRWSCIKNMSNGILQRKPFTRK